MLGNVLKLDTCLLVLAWDLLHMLCLVVSLYGLNNILYPCKQKPKKLRKLPENANKNFSFTLVCPKHLSVFVKTRKQAKILSVVGASKIYYANYFLW